MAELAAYGVTVTTPDPYLCALIDRYPDQVGASVTRMAAGKRRPPMTPLDIATALDRAGVPAFAQRLRHLLTVP